MGRMMYGDTEYKAKANLLGIKKVPINSWVSIMVDKEGLDGTVKYSDHGLSYPEGILGNTNYLEYNQYRYSKEETATINIIHLGVYLTGITYMVDMDYFIYIEIDDGSKLLITKTGKVLEIDKEIYVSKLNRNLKLKLNLHNENTESSDVVLLRVVDTNNKFALINRDGTLLLIETEHKSKNKLWLDVVTADRLLLEDEIDTINKKMNQLYISEEYDESDIETKYNKLQANLRNYIIRESQPHKIRITIKSVGEANIPIEKLTFDTSLNVKMESDSIKITKLN